ncbi:hypothetical protein B0I35DRAFT_441341 [Stachybotrys elegans]|uniref:Uncharacterized protein n=1 Tax=Stachybotrys elegans TaxID=80388 RepID=A0A8K0SGB6_9HYPO|nr:hypothetical protein B0I35DRAFT_441341 [Stachybotrys elegans]
MVGMERTLQLIDRPPLTVEAALDEEIDVLNWATYGPATEQLSLLLQCTYMSHRRHKPEHRSHP